MKSLLLLPFLLQDPQIIVLSKPWMTVVSQGQSAPTQVTQEFCEELKYNYLNEKTEMQNFISRQNFLKNELKKIYLGKKADLTEEQIFLQLQEINKNMKLVIEKLNYLADDKFTSAKYQLGLHWSMPVFKRHQDEEYKRILNLIKTDGFRALNNYEISLYRAGKPYTHRSYDLNYFYYAGEESKDLHHDFYVNTANNFTGIIRDKDTHVFSIKKQSSKLEICQFIPTLEIGLEIIETTKSEWMPAFESTKQLYLKFEESL